jgi:hypothetical protein
MENSAYSLWVTECGKILGSEMSYHNGQSSRFIVDPIVVVPDGWQDAQSSVQSLYWLTVEDAANLEGYPVQIAKVDYQYDFATNSLTTNPSDIGDRKVITPMEFPF